MELKRVEMIGFKSFPEKLSVEFDRGITAIIGPNGSGKSNISDAIRWVLGEQSARSLRGSRMEDVIFAGTERRRPLGYAQVTLVLDNHDHKIPLSFDEISICRRVYRSGESEYFVNQIKYRLKDIHEMLMDTGIGKDGYSVIGQGRIDQLLSTKPQERRLIFEEAAGIVKFKTRRDEARKQLAEEALSLERVNDRLLDMEQRLGPLKAQAETARQYKELDDELKVYEINSFLDQYNQYKAQYDKNAAQMEALQKDLEEAGKRQEEAKARSTQLAQEAEDAGAAVTAVYNELSQTRLDRESTEGDKRLAEQEKEHLEQEIRLSTQRLNEVKEKLSQRSRTVTLEERTLKELEKEDAEKEARQNTCIEEDRRQSEELLKCGQELLKKEHEVSAARAAVEELDLSRARMEAQVEQTAQTLTGVDAQVTDLIHAAAENAAKIQETEQRDQVLAEEESEVTATIDQLQEQDQMLREKLRAQQAEVDENQAESRRLSDRIKWLEDLEREYEGYSASVRTVMQLKSRHPLEWRTIKGTVADVIRVPDALTTAMNIALGQAVQNIIVDTQNDAHKLIEILRSRKAGRATFQPLDSVTGRDHGRSAGEIEKLHEQDPKILGFADTLISFDPEYQKVISRLLANVIVVEDFDTGASLSRKYNMYYRVVTLKGDIFNIGGSITGGSQAENSNHILGRRAEKDRTEKELRDQKEAFRLLAANLAALRHERDQLSLKVQDEKDRLYQIQEARLNVSQELSQYRFVSEQLEQQKDQFDREQQEQALEMEERDKRLAETKAALAEAESKLAALRNTAETLRQEQTERRHANEQLHVELMQLQMDRGAITQQRSSLERTMEWEYNEIEDLSTEADQILDQTASAREQIDTAARKVEASIAKIAQLTETIEALTQKSQELEALKSAKDREREQTINDTEEAIRIFSGLEKEQIRVEGAFNRAKKDLTNLQDQIWEKYELTYNAALRMEKKDLGSKTAVSRRISELRSAIRRLGPVNLAAIEEYDTLSERFAIDTAQRDDIVKATESLEQVIRQLTRQMEVQFKESFEEIAASFDHVFRRLFGGGRGILRLSEDAGLLERGIEIVAQPPGKKLQNMMLLSGGERALTAIALLFAIQQLSPAPFCILDEIEAALDDANVTRFADYLRELCHKTQFIVITHRKGTMEAADTMYGVTMEEKGISKCFSMKFEDTEEMEWIEDGAV